MSDRYPAHCDGSPGVRTMTLTLNDFEKFFTEINGYPPFRWQQRLCRSIVDQGEWPEHITAPTGAGKSAVIDVHLFVNALDAWGQGPRVPRRLAAVVNRRAIVDSHYDRSANILRKLEEAAPDSVCAKVREGLATLPSQSGPDSFILSRLRGGMSAQADVAQSIDWFDDPSACAVICATPDMWGSRLLFHGYGTSRHARPREAGLLARDSVMVLDEAHLNRQLLATARRCEELQDHDGLGVPVLQVVSTTATPGDVESDRTIGVDPAADLLDDQVLAQRLQRPKPLTLIPASAWPAGKKPSRAYAAFIAEQVVQQVDSLGAADTVGCVVNTVATALDVYGQLQKVYGHEAVLLWIGPLRPLDLQRMRAAHPDVFTVAGDPDVRVVVATQTLEVGVDIDLAALITELAPGTALAQRAGRVNRLGARDQGPCVVVVPEDEPTTRHGPYTAEDLARSYRWLQQLAARPEGIAPTVVAEIPPPEAEDARAVLSRLESGDVRALTATSERLVGEVILSWWLRDDLDAEPPIVGVVRRGALPADDGAALALLKATPVTADEIYPSSVATVRDVVEDVVRKAGHHRRAFCLHEGELSRLDIDEDPIQIRPGDTLIVDSDHRIVRHGLISAHGGTNDGEVIWGDADLVLIADEKQDVPLLRRVTRLLWEAADDEDAVAQDRAVELVREAHPELAGSIQMETPAVPDSASGVLSWAVVRSIESAAEQTEDTVQTWTGRGKVTLAQHQEAVAARAQSIATRVGLPEVLQRVLYEAGKHHDDGKLHPEFQVVLGAEQEPEPLAKSGDAYVELPRWRRRRTALPVGWRHEQLSAVFTAHALAQSPRTERELVIRLVGTSHGRGRAGFLHGAAEIRSGFAENMTEIARQLFDVGGWESLVEATEREWGAWECAYLEAVLRAADCMVSKEGS